MRNTRKQKRKQKQKQKQKQRTRKQRGGNIPPGAVVTKPLCDEGAGCVKPV